MITNNQHNNQVIEMIATAKQAFIGKQQDVSIVCDGVNLLEMELAGAKHRIFGVKKSEQYTIDYNVLRKAMFMELLQKQDGLITEVIGDGAKFDAAGSEFAKRHFASKMKQFNGILLYGYTGQEDVENSLVDANGVVNNYLDNNPEFAKYVVANLVDFDTRVALGRVNQPVPTLPECTGWGGVVSKEVRNFLLVWDNDSRGALFGEDSFLSDQLVNHKSILYGGGLQSFMQATNLLIKGVQLTGVAGLRGENNPATFIRGPGYNKHVPLLETALFFNMIKQLPGDKISAADLIVLRESYINTTDQPVLDDRALLINPFRADLLNRMKLWYTGWQQFMQHEVWEKIRSNLYIGEDADLNSRDKINFSKIRYR